MIFSTLNTLLSLLKKGFSFLGSPFINVTFAFKVIPEPTSQPICELRIYNLNQKNMMVKLTNNNFIEIRFPSKNRVFYENSWDSSESDPLKRTCKNSWLVLQPLQPKKYAKLIFKINNNSKVGKIKFYDYESRRTITVFFKCRNNNWSFKVGRLNIYKTV